jgi:cation:H+ antiporter
VHIFVGFYYLAGLAIGLLLLWWAGSRSVTYCRQTAEVFGLTRFFVGFVIMAVSTGIPELAVAFTSVFRHVPQLSVGDIIGSNFLDISLVLGIPALFIGPLLVHERQDRHELLFSLFISCLVMMLVFMFGFLYWWHGIFLILVYLAYLIWLHRIRHPMPAVEVGEVPRGNNNAGSPKQPSPAMKWKTTAKLLASLGLVILAAHMSVEMGIAVAYTFAWRLEVVGVAIFSIGTSLPELVFSVHAVLAKEYSLALGNAFGSVFEQATLILGLLAFISPHGINIKPFFSIIPFMFLSFFIVGFGMLKRRKIGKFEAIGMLLLVVCFFGYRLILASNYV